MMGKMEVRSAPGNRPRDGRHCDLCGCSQPAVRCDKCGCQIFCLSCDDMYHRHPKRRFHLRKAVDPINAVPQARPVLPMKVAHLNATNPGDPSKMPLPPPRKKKSLFSSFRKPSPSSDNSPPLPKKEYSWTDRLGNIKKFMSNRPLPPLPSSDDIGGEQQPTTNGQSSRGDLTFIHKRNEERPPQLPQRSPKSPEFPGFNQEKENRIPSSPGPIPGQARNGSLEQNSNHVNQNREFPNNEENHWNNRMDNHNGPQSFGTLNRHGHQRGFVPPGIPGYPMGMHQSSSATDLHSMHSSEGMPNAGPVPPHYPHYPMNPHVPPPHYPYPMYPGQYPNYPQYFGNSFANLSQPATSEGDFSDSESAPKHSSKKHHFRKRAKRSQSVMVDRMAYPGQFFPFGPYPGYPGPWGAPVPMEAPPSPASSVRSLTRIGRSRRRKKTTSEDEDEDDDGEFSVSSSPMKSSSSDPKDRAPLATQTTSSEEESGENFSRRKSKSSTMRRQAEPVSAPSPVKEINQSPKMKQNSSKLSDSEARRTPEIRTEKTPSMDSTIESHKSIQQAHTPSPSAPFDHWECKHCTFINPVANKICQVCCKTATPREETPEQRTNSRPPSASIPAIANSRPSSASSTRNRKGSVGSEREYSTPDNKGPEIEKDVEKKERQDMASLNSALDEAEKQISKGLEELMKLKDDIDVNMSKEKSNSVENQSETQNASKPVYKSSGKMRTSILDKLNLNKPQTSNASVSTSTETQTGQNNWISDKIREARRHSNSSTTSDAYNSPLAQSPDLERRSTNQKRDSSCQTQQDSIAEYLEKRKAAEEAFLGKPINNFGFGYGDRMDMVTSPVPSMYDRFYGGGFGMMQRSHSRASLFAGRMNDFGPMDYGGPGFGYGPASMYRSVSRSSLTGEYPDGRMSDFHNLRKPDYYLSMEELVERRRQDNIRAQGLELVRMIREAEQQGFNADDIQVALTHCGKQNPLEWLQENWRNMVDSVLTLSTNYGNDKKENDIGLLSENEARDALRMHKGNIWAAVTECVEGRQRKYLELSARGNFSRQDIVDALTASDGDVEMAYANLTKSTGKPFLMRIWGAGEGAQNQDGAYPVPEDFEDGPRMYHKDETLNSDELSEELWSEDGEWEEEDVYEEEERGDMEDLQTCHEDLQTSPQEMLTPVSEKSDYCDAFTIDDRNASSPSDDIFFVIPEAKPEKKKGFLSKFAALRKNSKEQTNVSSSPPEDYDVPEQALQAKEDTISQKSSSSSEQTKNNGALSTLKNTFSAIKDTVTGGSKSDKKLPCNQPEKRTIIVKGQMEHESLTEGSKVQLTSVKPLDYDIVPSPKPENKVIEPNKSVNSFLNKETVETKNDYISLNDTNFLSNPNESKHKIENKKPQSLAERLKFAKQSRSTTFNEAKSLNEGSISDAKNKETSVVENKAEKIPQGEINTYSKDKEEKNELDISNQSLNSAKEVHKDLDVISDISSVSNHSVPDKNVAYSEAVITSSANISTDKNFSDQIKRETSLIKSPTASNAESLLKNKIDSSNVKSNNKKKETLQSIGKGEEIERKSVPPVTELSKESKLTETNLHDNLIRELKENTTAHNSTGITSEKVKKSDKSDVFKNYSNLSEPKLISEVAKSRDESKNQSRDEVTLKRSSASNKNINVITHLKETDLKMTDSKTSISCVENDKASSQTSNSQATKIGTKTDIPKILNNPSELSTVENAQIANLETCVNKEDASGSSLAEEKYQDFNSSTENRVIGKNHSNSENVVPTLSVLVEENSLSNGTSTHEKYSNFQSVNSTKISAQSEIEIEKEKLNSISKSERISEIIPKNQTMEEIKSLPTASSTSQSIPERILEKTTGNDSKPQTDSDNSGIGAETPILPEKSGLDEKSNSTATVMGDVNEEASKLLEESTKENEIKPIPTLEASENSEVSLDVNSINNQSTKTGKLKGTKVSKLKRSLERDKKETKDKPELSTNISSSENRILSSEIENANEITNSSKAEVIESKKAFLKNETSSHVQKDTKLDNISQTEYKISANQKNIKTTEDNTVQSSNEVNKTLSETVCTIPPEPAQNIESSRELKSDPLAVDVSIPSTSKSRQNNVQEVLSGSDTKNTKVSSEISEMSPNVDNTPVSVETEPQKTEVADKVQDNKNNISNDAVSSTNNNVLSSEINITPSESVQEEFKIMAPVSSTTFPEKSKKIEISSSTTDNSTVTAPNATLPDSVKTVIMSSDASLPDNDKAELSSSSTTPSESSKIAGVNSSSVDTSDTSKRTEYDSNSSKKETILTKDAEEIPSNRSAFEASKQTTNSINDIPSNSKAPEASSSTISRDQSNKNLSPSGILSSSDKKEMVTDAKTSIEKQTEHHSNASETAMSNASTNEFPSSSSAASKPENASLKRTVSEDNTSQADESDLDDEDSDESRPSSVTPPSPVDALRNRFEVLAGGTVRGAPIRPASPFRRMSFNSRKQVIALEKKRDTSSDKPWFHQKIVHEPVKFSQPKRTIKQQLEMERKVRKMVADRKCRTYRKAEIVVQLMDMNFEEEEAIQAANECSTLEQAISYLQQECLLCTGNFPVSLIVSMTHCQHRACRECIRAYFTVQIRDRTILDLLCPFCNEPDITDEDVAQDYFNHLDIMLKKLVDVEIHELFQRKLRDRVLMKDPNFRWCSQCSSGFISMPNLKRLICPDCNAVTCASCRRLWEKEHQGISCEAFAALKDASDPEAHAVGLAKMLTEDGIDCPSCHFRYALAKGGCMHFRCLQCQHDFCSGCSRPFKMGQKCGVSEFCAKLGLHAHHPRNCLFYLRDKEPEDLQKLLDMNDIKYNKETPEGVEVKATCQVMEQKETADGMLDDHCGKEVQDGFAGLCRVHYVEYLGQLVNKYKVDPIQIFENDDLELVLRRANIRLPPKRYRESDAQYRDKLVNLIQEELPLDKMDGS